MFLDPAYNTIDSILLNVFMIAGVSAAYCLAYMERLFSHFNEKFIMVCFVLCSRQIARVVHNSLQSDSKFMISKLLTRFSFCFLN